MCGIQYSPCNIINKDLQYKDVTLTANWETDILGNSSHWAALYATMTQVEKASIFMRQLILLACCNGYKMNFTFFVNFHCDL